MNRLFLLFLVWAIIISTATSGQAKALKPHSIDGSSTLYPVAKTVAENFAKRKSIKMTELKPTGSGGSKTPIISDASRNTKKGDYDHCAENGVQKSAEVKIGYDAAIIVIANSKKAPFFKLTTKDIFLALAKNVPDGGKEKLIPNPYAYWSEVNPTLPLLEIKVYGPQLTSNTRDTFEKLAMEMGCSRFPWIRNLKKRQKGRFREICRSVREDGGYIASEENDNLIVAKLEANQDAIGIFSYSYLEQNQNKLQRASIGSYVPTLQNISSGVYPLTPECSISI